MRGLAKPSCDGQGLADALDSKLRRTSHKIIRQAENTEALGFQKCIAPLIMRAPLGIVVRRSVALDDQPMLEADEIHNVGTKWRLSAEFDAKASTAKGAPQQHFRLRRRLSLFTRDLRCELVA